VREKSLHLKSSLSELAFVRSEIFTFIGDDVSELWKGRIVLSIDEALSNVMRHGYRGREDGDIVIIFKEEASGYVFIISDQAPPYNPLSEDNLGDAVHVDGIGGLGIGVYRRFMNAEYGINEQGGNCLTLSWERKHEEDTVTG
jgi:serine/threonine-protein kinase RsbW